MLHHRSLKLASVFVFIAIVFVPVVSFMPAASPASAAFSASYSGTIASGAQFDLYTLELRAGASIVATLVCDELSPGNRPLDPVLSVYFPGSDSSDTINADVYNDDGFGQDDDPAGVDCNAFDSSRVFFTTPVAGTYTFRADGFGSSTGPYTLSISDSSGCVSLLYLPSTSVVGAFVTDAPVYSDPGVLTNPQITIEAGKTYWVLGVDATGQYYAIYIACSRVWVPVSSMGPNYDDVWQGRPLPTVVIESSAGDK
jgi:hypothetical protein